MVIARDKIEVKEIYKYFTRYKNTRFSLHLLKYHTEIHYKNKTIRTKRGKLSNIYNIIRYNDTKDSLFISINIIQRYITS